MKYDYFLDSSSEKFRVLRGSDVLGSTCIEEYVREGIWVTRSWGNPPRYISDWKSISEDEILNLIMIKELSK